MLDRIQKKVARLIVARLGSNMVPPRTAEDDADQIARLLKQYPIGGLILFNGSWPTTAETLERLQSLSADGLLVMTDMERGVGQQVYGATVFPHLAAFNALGESARTSVSEFAQIGAREALACGIHVAFAPIADVNRNPENPIISTRAFGDRSERVAELVQAYVTSAKGEGLLTTAKHFPGHGNTLEDSHETTPVVDDSREVLEAEDLPPFQAAIDAGVDLIMTAHVRYPSLDPSGRKATESPDILISLLRDQMEFDGVVITDSLHMAGALSDQESEAERAVKQLNAGVDMLLDLRDPEAVIKGVAEAATRGEIAETRLDEAIARVGTLKTKLKGRFGKAVFSDSANVFERVVVGLERHKEMAEQVAQQAIQIDGEPLLIEDDAFVLFIGRGVTPHLVQAIENSRSETSSRHLNPDKLSSDEAAEILSDVATAPQVIVAVVVKPAAWQKFGLSDEIRELVQSICAQKPTVVVSLGDPSVLDDFDKAIARICSYSDVPVSQKAVADLLLNQST